MSFFYHPKLVSNEIVSLNREESGHIARTLRGSTGDHLRLLNGYGKVAEAEILEISPKKVVCKIHSVKDITEPKTKIHLYLAPPRHNIMSPLVKQCVELGVWSINLIECEFSVSKPKDKKGAFESEIIAGAKQSGNPFFPQINSLEKFTAALKACPFPKFYGAVPEESVSLNSISKKGEISLWIGPEGGFSQKELNTLKESGAQGITIGNWILRVETALVALLGVLTS